MMQSTESSEGINLAFKPRADCGWPTCWRILRESEMSSVLVVIEDVLRHEPSQIRQMAGENIRSVTRTAAELTSQFIAQGTCGT